MIFILLDTLFLLASILAVFFMYWKVNAYMYRAVSKKGTLLASPFLAFGVIIHELSHFVAATLLFRRVSSMSLYSFDQRSGELGHVSYIHQQGRTVLTSLFDLIIGFAPIVGGAATIYFITYLFLDETVASHIVKEIYSVVTNSDPYQKYFWIENFNVYLDVFQTEKINWVFLIWIFLLISLSHGLIPSTADLKISLPAILILFIIEIFAVIISPKIAIPYALKIIDYLEFFLSLIATLGIPILIVFVMTNILILLIKAFNKIKKRVKSEEG